VVESNPCFLAVVWLALATLAFEPVGAVLACTPRGQLPHKQELQNNV
jgi:hypothetical protein